MHRSLRILSRLPLYATRVCVCARTPQILLPRTVPSSLPLASFNRRFNSNVAAATAPENNNNTAADGVEEETITADQVFAAGAMCFMNNDVDAAEKLFHEALEIDSNHIRSLLQLGIIWSNKGEHLKSLDFLEKAARLEDESLPKDIKSNVLHALARSRRLCKIGNMRDQVQLLKESIELNPKHGHALSDLGEILASNGDLHHAEIYLEQAMEAEPPADAETITTLASIKMQRGNFDTAKKLLEEALKQDDENSSALTTLGTVEVLMGNVNQGEQLLKKAVKTNPHSAKALAQLGQIEWIIRKNPKAARNLFEKALQVEPENLEILALTVKLLESVFHDKTGAARLKEIIKDVQKHR